MTEPTKKYHHQPSDLTKAIQNYFEAKRELEGIARRCSNQQRMPSSAEIRRIKRLQEDRALYMEVFKAHDYKPRHG